MSRDWIGKAIVQSRPGGRYVLVGRIIHVSEVDDLAFVIAAPRINKKGHVDHYVPCPQIRTISALAKELSGSASLRLAEFEIPTHWLWTDEQLRGDQSDGTGLRRRYRPSKWFTKQERAYALIEPLVNRKTIAALITDAHLPAALAKRAAEVGKGYAVLRRAMNAYLFGLGNPRALLPWYIRCGGPGSERHSKVTTGRPSIAASVGKGRMFASVPSEIRKVLGRGWRRFMKPGVSVKTALARTLQAYLVKSVKWKGNDCEVQLMPEGAAITQAMFRYWGTKASNSLTARQIDRGETEARREYRRRLNTMKGRYQTANQEAFLDSTSTDQTLVSAASSLKVLSAPWRTEVLGASIDYIFGVHVAFDAPSATTALLAILHAATDKVDFCRRYGHVIEARDWHGCTFSSFSMDNGEGKGSLALHTLEQLQTAAHFGAAYDAINKAPAESGHRQRQRGIDHLLPGSTMGRRKRRGEPHRADLARLRFDDYMHELIKEILTHNNEDYVDPPLLEMSEGIKECTRRGVLEWQIAHHYVSSAPVDLNVLRVACLPRIDAVMHGDGLHLFVPGSNFKVLIPDFVYRSDWLLAEGYIARARGKSWRLQAHLDPSMPSLVWVNLGGLKCLTLQTHDERLQTICLLDWLLIVGDRKLARYWASIKDAQNQVNKAARLGELVKQGDARRKSELAASERKPSKSFLRSGVSQNTALEAAAMSGLPKARPTAINAQSSDGYESPLPPAADPLHAQEELISLLEELYEDNGRNKRS